MACALPHYQQFDRHFSASSQGGKARMRPYCDDSYCESIKIVYSSVEIKRLLIHITWRTAIFFESQPKAKVEHRRIQRNKPKYNSIWLRAQLVQQRALYWASPGLWRQPRPCRSICLKNQIEKNRQTKKTRARDANR